MPRWPPHLSVVLRVGCQLACPQRRQLALVGLHRRWARLQHHLCMGSGQRVGKGEGGAWRRRRASAHSRQQRPVGPTLRRCSSACSASR